MFEYIVSWVIVKLNFGSSPLPPPKYDQFGRDTVKYSHYVYSVISLDTTRMSRSFKIRKDAVAFYNAGVKASATEVKQRENGVWSDEDFGKIDLFKLDSIKIK